MIEIGTYIEMTCNLKSEKYEVVEKMHLGKNHLVVQVTMIVEGVLNGSMGPLLHLAEDFGKMPGSWDGIPVVINHPYNEEGMSISANAPDILETMMVGRVFNTHVQEGHLKADVWLEEEKLKVVSPDIYSALKARKPIEVSMGAFTENIQEQGTYNDIQYNAIAKNHRPDHLALLPGSVGACSLSDGCGIHANENKEEEVIINNLNEEIEIMADAKTCTPCVEKKVNDLIANKQTKFTDDDKAWLQTLEESVLDKMVPEVVEPLEVEKIVEKTVVNELSKEDKAALDFGKKMLAKRKADMVKGIQTNTKQGTWPDAVLANMDEEMLERIFNSVKKEEDDIDVDFSLNGNRASFQSNDEPTEKLLPPGVE